MKKSSLDSLLNISLEVLQVTNCFQNLLFFLRTVTLTNDIHDTNVLSLSFFNQKKMSFCSVSKNGTKRNDIEGIKKKNLKIIPGLCCFDVSGQTMLELFLQND